jgi:L-ascorbate 6-phosphate lactonase
MNAIDAVLLNSNEVAILWLGQNAYVLKTRRGTQFAIDPYLTRDRNYRYIHPEPPVTPAVFNVDYIFCTHDHLDHTDSTALPSIAAYFPNTMFFGPQESCDHLIELGIDHARVKPVQAQTTYTLKDVEVTPFYSILPNEAVTTHLGYLFKVDNTKIYNMGDTNHTVVESPETVLDLVAHETPNIAMFPIIGDTPERKPDDAYKFAKIVKPQIVIPCHYDCFADRTIDPQEFVVLLQNEPGIETVIIPYKGLYIYKP